MDTAAVLFVPDGYDTRGKRLMGRQAAGEGFLKAIARHGRADALFAYTAGENSFQRFGQMVRPFLSRPKRIEWVPLGEPERAAAAGVIYRPDPILSDLAWRRRYGDPRLYSLCGVTHTIATRPAMQALADLLLAPVEPWDAVICTSRAVRTAVDRLLGGWAEYLAARGGGRFEPRLELPIIPLGVDCDGFATAEAPASRRAWREQLRIADDAVAVLFLGRLSFGGKAHPVPMMMAAEQVARRTGRTLHLILAGWFESERDQEAFREAAGLFAPRVRTSQVDGRQPTVRSGIWHAADIFMSLSDNIQETFGLTPIEAMAAGLPVIISDWNGYQETVRHEVDGFKIPTRQPPAGTGEDIAQRFLTEAINYSTFIGYTAMSTVVDYAACRQALEALVHDDSLRARMAAAGQARARELYDWSVVIRQYEDLWAELGVRRRAAEPQERPSIPAPLTPDPFTLFGHYASDPVDDETMVSVSEHADSDHLIAMEQSWTTRFGYTARAEMDRLLEVVHDLREHGPKSLGALIEEHHDLARAPLVRGLLYLAKFDLLRLG